MDVLLGWLFNIFELTFFKRNIKGLFPYPDNQVKKAKEETNKQQKKVFQVFLGQDIDILLKIMHKKFISIKFL